MPEPPLSPAQLPEAVEGSAAGGGGASPADGSPPDDTLLGAVAGRDADALARLYDRYVDELFGVALRILGEAADAEEVVADAFMRVWRSAGRYDHRRGSVAAWLVTIARNRAIDRLRTRRSRDEAGRAAEPDIAAIAAVAGDDPERAAMRSEYRERVRSALNELTAEQRRAIDLALYGGLSHSEIARRLDEPLGTVKTRIRTGMQKLRTVLAPVYRDEFA